MYKAETTKKLLRFVKYDYESKFGPSEELYGMKVDAETTIKDVKNKLNESFIFGELEPNQYFIHKNGEQEVKDKNINKKNDVFLLQI